MGTYFYSGLHPRMGTIPVHTFFHGLGGKPVIAMKSSIIIEGQSLQKVQLKEVKAIMNAYEQFLIPSIYETNQEYDYALLVENLDNDSIPDKVANCSSKPGETVMGIIIDNNLLDGTYTVGCGPQVFKNVTSDFFISISPQSEFPCVQIQRGFDSCISSGKICDSKSSIKKLLDPMTTITSQESSASPQHSTKHERGHVTPSLAAMALTTSASSLSTKSPPTKAATQGKKLKSSTSSSGSQSLKSSLQQTQNNPTKSTPFKPFTGWSSSLRNENLLETYGDSSSDESLEEDPWALPDPIDPFRNPARTPITEFLREQPLKSKSSQLALSTTSASSSSYKPFLPQVQTNSTKSSNPKPSTSSASLSYKSLHPQVKNNSTKSSNFPISTSSARALSSECREEDPLALPDPIDPFRSSARTPFTKCLREQEKKSKSNQLAYSTTAASSPFPKSPQVQISSRKSSSDTYYRLSPTSLSFKPVYPPAQTTSMNSSNLTPSASSLSYKSLNPQAERSQLNPFINSASSLRSESLQSQAQSNQLNPFKSSGSSWNEISKPLAHSRHLEPSESTASSLRYESLLPQAPPDPTLQHSSSSTVPVIENESDIQACSEMSLEDFEALKPTLSSLEKNSKIIENYMTVTI